MNKLQITKSVVQAIVTVGTGTIVKSIIQNNVAPKNVTDQVTVTVASFALGGMVSEITAQYTNAKIDQIAAFVNENFKK